MDFQLGLAALQALLNLVIFKRIALGGTAFALAMSIGSLYETVEQGTFQVRQAAITGTMSARMTPGMWPQLFGKVVTWPKSSTYRFAFAAEAGEAFDRRIEVRFNDGSIGQVSGALRVVLPTCEEQAIDLAGQYGYRSYDELERDLILPIVRNALRLTASLMSPREAQSERRVDFSLLAADQVENGAHETEIELQTVRDPVTWEESTRAHRRIKRTPDGRPVHQRSPLEALGIKLENFEVHHLDVLDRESSLAAHRSRRRWQRKCGVATPLAPAFLRPGELERRG